MAYKTPAQPSRGKVATSNIEPNNWVGAHVSTSSKQFSSRRLDEFKQLLFVYKLFINPLSAYVSATIILRQSGEKLD